MAKIERYINEDFDQLLSKIEDGIINGSMAATLEVFIAVHNPVNVGVNENDLKYCLDSLRAKSVQRPSRSLRIWRLSRASVCWMSSPMPTSTPFQMLFL